MIRSRTYLIAGALALASAAGAYAAETSNVPLRAGEMSTMTNGAPNVSTQNYSYVPYAYSYVYTLPPSTAVMGAGPVTYTYVIPPQGYTPNWHAGASETSNVPLRAGEMSTMTNGAPNVSTENPPY